MYKHNYKIYISILTTFLIDKMTVDGKFKLIFFCRYKLSFRYKYIKCSYVPLFLLTNKKLLIKNCICVKNAISLEITIKNLISLKWTISTFIIFYTTPLSFLGQTLKNPVKNVYIIEMVVYVEGIWKLLLLLI